MIILYTTHCPKCKILERKLKDSNISYEVCEDISLMEDKGFVTVPMLEINNKIYDFSAAMNWIKQEGNCLED